MPAWWLLCWYVLRRRPNVPAEAIRDAWMPVANLYVWFMLPLFTAIAIIYFFFA